MTFEAVWADLKNRLKAGIELRGWSRDKGHTSLRFRIDDVAASSITVSSSTMTMPRSIGKSDFARVYGARGKYRAGKVTRAEMTELSQNTSYIFAILRWQEGEGISGTGP
jgi:hypothetical protein